MLLETGEQGIETMGLMSLDGNSSSEVNRGGEKEKTVAEIENRTFVR